MGFVHIEVDVDDIMDEVLERASASDLEAELESRNRERTGSDPREAAQAAIAQIRRGDYLDAITTLEREFWPKWATVQDSEAALRLAQAANDNQEAAAAASEGGE